MIHNMMLNVAPFEMISSGKKTYELRLYDEKRRTLAVGDTIIFTSRDGSEKKICCKVKSIQVFPDFETLYGVLPLLKCGYTERDIATASPSDMYEYYSETQVKNWGVVGIEIELIT